MFNPKIANISQTSPITHQQIEHKFAVISSSCFHTNSPCPNTETWLLMLVAEFGIIIHHGSNSWLSHASSSRNEKCGKHPSGDVMISPKYHCHPLPSCSCIVGHQIRLQAPSLSTASFQHGCRPTRPMRLGCWLGWLLVSNVGWKWHTQISWQHLISSPNNYTIYIHKEYIKKFYCLVSWWRMAKFHNHVWKGIIQRPHGQFLQQLHSDSRSTTWNGGLTRGG